MHSVVHAFVARNTDFCNAVLYGNCMSSVSSRQYYTAARLITGSDQNQHIMSTRHADFHLAHLIFETALMAFDCARPFKNHSTIRRPQFTPSSSLTMVCRRQRHCALYYISCCTCMRVHVQQLM